VIKIGAAFRSSLVKYLDIIASFYLPRKFIEPGLDREAVKPISHI